MEELMDLFLVLIPKPSTSWMFLYLTGQLLISQGTDQVFQDNSSCSNRNFYDRYKYPLEENVKENQAEDKRCLAKVEAILEDQKKKGVPCVGMIVEPIQSEGGDHHGSSAWFQVSLVMNYKVKTNTKQN